MGCRERNKQKNVLDCFVLFQCDEKLIHISETNFLRVHSGDP